MLFTDAQIEHYKTQGYLSGPVRVWEDQVIALTAKAVSFTLLLFRRLVAHRRVGSIRLGLQRGQGGQCSLPR